MADASCEHVRRLTQPNLSSSDRWRDRAGAIEKTCRNRFLGNSMERTAALYRTGGPRKAVVCYTL